MSDERRSYMKTVNLCTAPLGTGMERCRFYEANALGGCVHVLCLDDESSRTNDVFGTASIDLCTSADATRKDSDQ